MSLGLVLALAAAGVIGLVLGGLGGGGSILTVPILVYLAGVDAKPAIAMSLIVVGVTAAVALIPHARAGRVAWRVGALFGSAGMVGAYLGGRVAAFIPANVLLVAFGIMTIATAWAMLRSRSTPSAEDGPAKRRPVIKILLEGVAVGLVTGLVGAGGGFLVVPALVLLGGLSMPTAIGTSLLVIAMKSGAAFAGYLSTTTVDWPLTAAITALAVLGSFAGAKLAGRIDPKRLRQAFAWFVVVIGVGMILGQLL
ncbi:sulfite exporter TauE/SafE family protein [Pilimelia columellifera]|uniref:Probable membrane transporter protein n=1 Tax=Pilimelia columellifera subsp. columellifera TaxID=706583 RepID=A0ABN3N9H9_9ACTN